MNLMISPMDTYTNPISTFYRLYATHPLLTGSLSHNLHGIDQSDLDFLLEYASDRIEDSRFMSRIEKYAEYTQLCRDQFLKLAGKEFVFLDFINPRLKDAHGRYRMDVIDDFDSTTELARVLMHQITKLSPEYHSGFEQLVFFRMGPYHFPFTIVPDEVDPYMINPFHEVITLLNNDLVKSKKRPLGSFSRKLSDTNTVPNYKSSLVPFSAAAFHKAIHDGGSDYLNASHQQYTETLNISLSLEQYQKLCEAAIALNRELLKKRDYTLITATGAKSPIHRYMLEGAVGMELLAAIEKEHAILMHTIGGKLLTSTKYLPCDKDLNIQAINKFFGWYFAHFYGIVDNPLVIKKELFKEPLYPHESIKYPFIIFGKDSTRAEQELENVPREDMNLLKADIAKYQFSISTIEQIIYRLNRENVDVYTDTGAEKSWREILQQHTVHPLYIADIRDLEIEVKRNTRPSNASAKCPLQQFVSTVPSHIFPPGIIPNDQSKSGTLIHYISNVVGGDQKSLLTDLNLSVLDRNEYCEVPIIHRYKPTISEWNYTQELLESRVRHETRKRSTPPSILPQLLLDELHTHPYGEIIIKDGGSPDGVAIIRETLQPIIIDYKRRIARTYPVKSFFVQTARYGLSVIENKKLPVDTFYVVIVQTPYSRTKCVEGEPSYDRGKYRNQVLRIREVKLDSEFMRDVKSQMIIEYLTRRIFKNDISNAFKIREEKAASSCPSCIINTPTDYKCRYILEQKREPWPRE
ncbi:MAG: hypothetical protein WC916_01095 [Candidatus Woesearchaeota archaeon]